MLTNKSHIALAITDDEQLIKLIKSLLKVNNIETVTASKDEEIIAYFNQERNFDLIIADYDLAYLPGDDLISMTRENNYSTPILVVSKDVDNIKIDAYASGANFVINNPFGEAEFIMVARNLIELSVAREHLEDAKNIIEALGYALEARDTYTEGHGKRVASLSVELYDALGLNDRRQRHDLYIGAILHDLGKIGVPDSILKSPNRLTDDEFEHVKKHTDMGREICKNLPGINGSLEIIKYHHERIDGSGYPEGLDDGDIPMLAQIVAIPDVFDALTTKRTYREKMTVEMALSILRKDAEAGKLNKEFVASFEKLIVDKHRRGES